MKYPRTYHVAGSKKESGSDMILFSELKSKYLVVEEKMDGSMVSIYFDGNGDLKIQHRNQEARGKEFDFLKQWVYEYGRLDALFERLEDRYVMYGEWLFACHTIYYDYLPSYFMEYDIYDRENDIFLSTKKREQLLFGVPVYSVKVLESDRFANAWELDELITSSWFVSIGQTEKAVVAFEQAGLRRGDALAQLDLSGQMEGLYIKHEDENQVLGRYKFIRKEFVDKIIQSGHWQDRPLVQNQLK